MNFSPYTYQLIPFLDCWYMISFRTCSLSSILFLNRFTIDYCNELHFLGNLYPMLWIIHIHYIIFRKNYHHILLKHWLRNELRIYRNIITTFLKAGLKPQFSYTIKYNKEWGNRLFSWIMKGNLRLRRSCNKFRMVYSEFQGDWCSENKP